jgi:hypothetical protein
MTPLLLKIQHHFGEISDLSILSTTALTDLPVNTKNAPKPAVGEKDRPRPTLTTEGSLLSMVWVKGRNHESRGPLTKPFLTIETPCSTLSRTEATTFHDLPEFLAPAFQLTTTVQGKVGRFKLGTHRRALGEAVGGSCFPTRTNGRKSPPFQSCANCSSQRKQLPDELLSRFELHGHTPIRFSNVDWKINH